MIKKQQDIKYGIQIEPPCGPKGTVPCGPIHYGPFHIDICEDLSGELYLQVRTTGSHAMEVLPKVSNMVEIREHKESEGDHRG